MGVNVDATIMYGMVLWDEDETYVEVPWRDEESNEGEEQDFDDWVSEQMGLAPLDYSTYPDEKYDPRVESYDTYRAREKGLSDAWRERVGAAAHYEKKRELLATVPVEMDYGGYEGRVNILRLKAAPKLAASYVPRVFGPQGLFVDRGMDLVAEEWLAQYGVTWDPKWLLVPYYG